MTASTPLFRAAILGAALASAMLSQVASAQTMDHSRMQMPAKKPVPAKQPARKKPAAKPAAPASTPDAAGAAAATKPEPAPEMDPAMDHSAMGEGMQDPKPAADPSMPPMDHAAMDHDTGTMPADPAEPMNHPAMAGMTMAPTEPVTPIPALTEADRAAARPPPGGHTVHDNEIFSYWLLDRLETWDADPGTGLTWEALSWIGTDLNRVWLRSEGERVGGTTESADVEVLYGRSIARWWDVVAGIRQDFGQGPSQSFAAVGVQGLAPYKFEVEATAYVGQSGQTAARFEATYDTLLTNRLILQWRADANVYGKDDAARGVGSGLSTVEAGLRLRYEFSRKFAPYIGISRERAFGTTANYRRLDGENVDDTRFVAGLRIWF